MIASPPLLPDQSGKHAGTTRVAPRQPTWFAEHPVQPFDSGSSHPQRCPSPLARQKIDRGTDTQGDTGVKTLLMSVHPELLFRRTQAHDQHIRLSVGDAV